jgi:hypothetical protein
MAAGQYPILIEQGATFALDLIVKSSPTEQAPAGEPIDLAGATITGQIRPDAGSDKILATFDGIVTDPASGGLTLLIPAARTRAIDPFTYPDAVYDILITFPNGTVRRLIEGTVTISPGVTR